MILSDESLDMEKCQHWLRLAIATMEAYPKCEEAVACCHDALREVDARLNILSKDERAKGAIRRDESQG